MKNFNYLIALTILTVTFSSYPVMASVININTVSTGTAVDSTANGTFNILSRSLITPHAQKTDFINVFTVSRGILEFDILPISAPIEQATLDFYITRTKGPNTSIDILGYEGNGVVELSDAYLGDSVVASYEDISTGSFSFNVTDYIVNLDNNNIQFSGFNIRVASEYSLDRNGYNNEINIISFDSGLFLAPVLKITTVPLPASIWFFLSALIAMVNLGHRKLSTK